MRGYTLTRLRVKNSRLMSRLRLRVKVIASNTPQITRGNIITLLKHYLNSIVVFFHMISHFELCHTGKKFRQKCF